MFTTVVRPPNNKYKIMTWLIVIIVIAIVGGLFGYFSGDDGNRGESAAAGAAGAALGCGTIIFQIALAAFSLYLIVLLAGWLFG
mgnify:CR=1 FL=1